SRTSMRQCHPKSLMWQGVPRFQRGALSPTGLRHVVLRAGFDRKIQKSQNREGGKQGRKISDNEARQRLESQMSG
ncbi:MAG: hypothetical protein OEM58_11790, partial [Nitrospirota bacterium]|nr:hypothetical protein [Nitrospirota bacterium]